MRKNNYTTLLLVLLFVVGFSSCSEDLADVSETIYVQVDKVKMPVYIRGNVKSKTLILIVHGGPGGSGWEYKSGEYAVLLEAKYGMAYWDQRGQGMAQGKFGDDDLTIDIMTNDLKAVILSLKHKYGVPCIIKIMRLVFTFPAPLGPTIPHRSPRSTLQFTFFNN